MGRYRPPPAKQAGYITASGAARLRKELDWLWRVKRPAVTQAVTEAAAQGDRSENAEYIYGKKQLREIDRRVRYLGKRLDELVEVSRVPDDQSRIYFGASFELEDAQGDITRFRIVGPDEIDTSRGWISLDSPMARAVMRKQLDDEVTVHSPRGEYSYLIVSIWYEDPTST